MILPHTAADVLASRYRPDELVLAGPGRRLSGYLIEQAIIFVGVFVGFLTLGILLIPFVIGYLIWFIFTAINGQTPGKQLLGMYIMRADGTRAGGGYVWLRELVVKILLFWLLTLVTFGIIWIVGALWCLWDRDNQCLWDKVTSTYVAWSPCGFRPMTSAELALAGGSQPPMQQAYAYGPHGVSEQLRDLARLHEEGIINDDEYEARRKALVERL